MFVLFTVISYFAIRNLSKKEVREEAREIIKDSSKFKEDVLDVLRGEFDGAYLSHEGYDEILKTIQEDVASLKNYKEEQEEKKTEHSKEMVKPKQSTGIKRKTKKVSFDAEPEKKEESNIEPKVK